MFALRMRRHSAPACVQRIGTQRTTAPNPTDQIAPAIPPAQSDTNPRACQTRDTESAPQSRTPNLADRAAQSSKPPPTLPTRHPIAVKYAKMPQTAAAIPHPASKPPRYPATRPAAPPPPAPKTCHPAAAQIETPARHGHASKQTSPRDDTTRNVHRKIDIPQQARLIPPEKHSTSTAPTPVSHRARQASSIATIHRNDQSQIRKRPTLPACHSFQKSLSWFSPPSKAGSNPPHEVQQHPRSHRPNADHPPQSPGERFARRSLGQSRLHEPRRLRERPHRPGHD